MAKATRHKSKQKAKQKRAAARPKSRPKARVKAKPKAVQKNVQRHEEQARPISKPKPKLWKDTSLRYKQAMEYKNSRQKGKVYEEAGVIVRLNVPRKRIEPVIDTDVLSPMDITEVKKVIHDIVGKELDELDTEFQQKKTCIVCGGPAGYYIKHRANDTYCRECAMEYFKSLTYLEKI